MTGAAPAGQPMSGNRQAAQYLTVCNLDRMAYPAALDLQLRLLALRQQDRIGDVLLLLEHPPVLTLGTRGQMENIYRSAAELAAAGVAIHQVNRGGDVTYHGPGQLVGYLIMRIDHFPGSIRGLVSTLEQGLIRVLAEEFGIEASQRHDKFTGVWVQDTKIAAIGIAVKQWVTMHGFALNVNTDLRHFDWINPCGLSMGVTSITAQTGQPADFDRVSWLVGRSLAAAFGRTAADADRETILALATASVPSPE